MADSPRFVDLSVRTYRICMHAYPLSFRREYGCEMTQVFHDMVTDSIQQHGFMGLMTTCFRMIGDLVCSASREHILEFQGNWTSRTAPGWTAKLLALLSISSFWILPFSPILAMAAVSVTKRSAGWTRNISVIGAILCTAYTLTFAGLLLSRTLSLQP